MKNKLDFKSIEPLTPNKRKKPKLTIDYKSQYTIPKRKKTDPTQ